MKTAILQLLFIILLAFGSSAQGPNHTVRAINNSDAPIELQVLPWDSTQLIQVNRMVNMQTSQYDFWMENVTSGTPVNFYVPLVSQLSGIPVFTENGILAAGEGLTGGMELHYFDGTTVTNFDLLPGPDGSEPRILESGGDIFVIAKDTLGSRLLYKFDESTLGVTQISSSIQGTNVTSVAGVINDTIYYTIEFDTPSNRMYQLLKAHWNGNNYVSNVNRAAGVPLNSEYFYYWSSLIRKWDRVFMTESKLSADFQDTIEHSVVIEGIGGYHSYTVPNILNGNNYAYRLFEFQDKIYAYLPGFDTLRSYSQYISGFPVDLEVDFISQDGALLEHYISENDQLYFKKWSSGNTNEVALYSGGALQPLFTGNDLHFLMENDGIAYLSDNLVPTDSNAVILLNTSGNFFEVKKIEVGEHSPVNNASLIYEDKFTFLFTTAGNSHVYQLNTDLGMLGLPEPSQAQLSLYPNPVYSGQTLNVSSNQELHGVILNSLGQEVMPFELKSGESAIDIGDLSSGVYILVAGDSKYKFVVQ